MGFLNRKLPKTTVDNVSKYSAVWRGVYDSRSTGRSSFISLLPRLILSALTRRQVLQSASAVFIAALVY